MKFAISTTIGLVLLAGQALSDVRHEVLRNALVNNGLQPTVDKPLSELGELGKEFFQAEALSLNGEISCQQCHLREFGSGDGIPVSAGLSSQGKGRERVESAYRFLPRNSLALWGRGAEDFNTFFWDGRVDASSGSVVSQFGGSPPSDDPLIVAVHLPPVETVEMLDFDEVVQRYLQEDADLASGLYAAIVENLRVKEPNLIAELATISSKSVDAVEFVDVAQSISAFIEEEFNIHETDLHRFVFQGGELSEPEINGGLIFYGKGRCVSCHNGPHFSDLNLHAIPFPQLGQGRNGFGIDYGQFNVTHDPADLYKFRTPPLWDVGNTAPYGHSGSVATLEEAIVAHFDPLRLVAPSQMAKLERHEFYKAIAASGENLLSISYLEDSEINDLISFLRLLDQPAE
ncbi:methylamine utilization protein MauG [Sulfitobacter sp. JL08]|nr:methylamine utilization protein MauG [Sulfitobacter sp. JL08]